MKACNDTKGVGVKPRAVGGGGATALQHRPLA